MKKPCRCSIDRYTGLKMICRECVDKRLEEVLKIDFSPKKTKTNNRKTFLDKFKHCEFHLANGTLCDNIVSNGSEYCFSHECLKHTTTGKCKKPIIDGSAFCIDHIGCYNVVSRENNNANKLIFPSSVSDGYVLSDGYSLTTLLANNTTVFRLLPPEKPISEDFINALAQNGATDSFLKQIRNRNKSRVKPEPSDLKKELDNIKFDSEIEKKVVCPILVVYSLIISATVSFSICDYIISAIIVSAVISSILAFVLYLLIFRGSNKKIRIAELKYNESMEPEWDKIIEEHDKENVVNINNMRMNYESK